MAKVAANDLWFCADCVFFHACGDLPEEEKRVREIEEGTKALLSPYEGEGPGIVPDFDSDSGEGIVCFSRRACDCCDSPLAGERHRFAILVRERYWADGGAAEDE